MSKFRPNRNFRMEHLEDRRLMTGDIHAFMQNGTLFINEAAGHVGGNQSVLIAQLSNGKVRVQGITSPSNIAGSNILNAQGVDIGLPEFQYPAKIVVNFGAGRDEVHLISNGVQYISAPVTINTADPNNSAVDHDFVTLNNFETSALEINTGSGQDTVRLVNSFVGTNDLTLRTGVASAIGFADADNVFIDGLNVQGHASILTGASNDTVVMKNTSVGLTDQDLLWFDLGAGADTLKLGPDPGAVGAVTTSAGLRIDAGFDSQNDADRVDMQDVFTHQSIFMQLGAGDDVVNMVNVQSRKNIDLRGMLGNDTMTLTQVEAFENFFATMGEGSDTLDITFVKARRVELDGGAGDGYDRLFLYQSPNIPTLIRTNFEEINGQKLIKKTATFPGVMPTASR